MSTGLPVLEGRRVDEGLAARIASHKSGGRDLWSPPREDVPEDREGAVLEALGEVLDPELPISLVDLGLICGVRVEGRSVEVSLTYTATACPCMEFIQEDVRDRLEQERWIDEVALVEVWDPPWTTDRITAAGREALRRLGVGT